MRTTEPNWRKSSYSTDPYGESCVEVAHLPETVGVRDSKNPAAGMLAVPAAPWQTFLVGLR